MPSSSIRPLGFYLLFSFCLALAACQRSSSDLTEEGGALPPADSLALVDSLPQQQVQKQQQQITQQRGARNNRQPPSNLRGNQRPTYDTLQPPVPPPARNRIQIALLLDTSNSMDGLIEQAKSQLWKMVNELAKAKKEEQSTQLELALFEYGNDWLQGETGYIRMVSRMTIDLEWISSRLFRLKTNGGSEFCPWAIKDATETLSWSDNPNDYKVIFIAGNESFRQGRVAYPPVCAKAKEKGIIINTIFCGDYDEGVKLQWGQGANCARGQYMNIDQSEKVVHIPTPFDEEVLRLNEELNDTYVGFGRRGREYKSMQSANDAAANSVSSANQRTRAFYKSKSNYQNTNWDLVDATEEDYEGFMAKIKPEELPEELREMTPEERKAHIEGLRSKRKKLQQQLAELEQKVDAFIVEKRKTLAEEEGTEANTLDAVMIGALRKQASEKGFVFP